MTIRSVARRFGASAVALSGLVAAGAPVSAGPSAAAGGTPLPRPLHQSVAGPRSLDLLGTWILVPGSGAESLRLTFEQRRGGAEPKCALLIDVPAGPPLREECTLKRDGDALTISGQALRGRIRRPADDLRLLLQGHDRMVGRWSAAPDTEVQLVLRGSNAETALSAPPPPDPAQLAAELKRRQEETLHRLTDLVRIPAGTFQMGSSFFQAMFSPSERPRHPVQVAAFDLGRSPVTFEQWDPCVEDGVCVRPDDLGWGRGGRPVVGVSVEEMQTYLAWLSKKTGREFRLPTEAEWEYAARAGTTTSRFWGDGIGRANANCIGCGSAFDGKQSSPIGSFQPNAFGLGDMLGNVWQLVADCWHDDYAGAPPDSVAWPASGTCNRRIVRGGSWNRDADFARAARRVWLAADARFSDVGFRVAATPP